MITFPFAPSAAPLTFPNAVVPDLANRNVIDEYKTKADSEIREALDAKRSEMVTICMNLTSDFNKASVLRASNAFLGKAVYVVGQRKFDKRGTVGTHIYENLHHVPLEEWESFFQELIDDGYIIFPIDNRPEYNPRVVHEMDFPEKSAFLYGEEGLGLANEVIEACNGEMVYIRQRGSVRSLNVAQAAAVVMAFYDSKYSE